MTPDEQEALSHQHYCGFWLVMLDNGNFAVYERPNGPLIRIVDMSQGYYRLELIRERNAAIDRYEAARAHKATPALTHDLNLGDLQL